MSLLAVLLALQAAQASPTPVAMPRTAAQLMEAELAKLPRPVFDLFYAVKDSLDYPAIPNRGRPWPTLEEFSRVTPKLLTTFNREFRVVSYKVIGADFELVVCRRSDPAERYRAMRTEKFVWRSDRWESLGGYYYF